ncbi:MAG: TonB-dependent receptor [Nonlabens sp.]
MRIYYLLFFLLPLCAFAQTTPSTVPLDSVAITAYRSTDDPAKLPFSVSRVRFRESGNRRLTNKQQLNLSEYLDGVPGLFSLNSQNYAQDLRVSVRGFGARSAFGIRGIKILVDGIPETTSDGQGQLDNLNLGIISSIEVIRGPAAILYGNASGGAIAIETLGKLDSTYYEINTTAGSYGMNQQQFTGAIKGKDNNTFINASRTATDGYRERSAFESYNFNLKHKRTYESHKFTALLNYANSPEAEDPGSLDHTAVDADRRQARDRNELFRTSEEINQIKLGISHGFEKNAWQWNNYAFYSYRDFEARLPFVDGGAVAINRNYGGVGTALGYECNLNKLDLKTKVGLDYGYQNDARKRFNNNEGIVGNQTLNQDEIFAAIGVYFHQRITYNRWNLLAGIRYDNNLLEVDDFFLSDSDGSDKTNLNIFNVSAGLSYNWKSDTSLYANFSTSFETPVLSELSANPNNDGGFNPDLDSQRAQNYELGYRTYFQKAKVEAAVFYINTSNDIVPFELAAFPDRSFFRNAGNTNRLGVELSYEQALSPDFYLLTSYTYSDFKYDDYEVNGVDFKDNRLPALPVHNAAFILTYSKKDLYIQFKNIYRGKLFADDANEVEEEDVLLTNISGNYKFKLGKTMLSPFLGVNNLFDVRYNDNIRINAFGGRYFEPAPGINFYGGLRLRF